MIEVFTGHRNEHSTTFTDRQLIDLLRQGAKRTRQINAYSFALIRETHTLLQRAERIGEPMIKSQ